MKNLTMRDFVFKGLGVALIALFLGMAAGPSKVVAQTTATPSSSSSGTQDDCDENSQFFKDFMQTTMARQALEAMAWQTGYMNSTDKMRQAWPTYKSPLVNLHTAACVDFMNKFYDLIGMLFGRAEGVYNMLISFVNQLISVACQYVAASINNVLNAICIPLPDMFSLPGFGGPERKSCNGISLADVISFTSDPPYLSSNISSSKMRKDFLDKTRAPISRGTSATPKGLGM